MRRRVSLGVLRALAQAADAWLLPPVCAACGVLLRPGPAPLPLCRGCALGVAPLSAGEAPHALIEAAFEYEAPWAGIVTRLKFGGDAAAAGPLGRLLLHAPSFVPGRYDAVVPVPLSRRRMVLRGYDQALLLTRAALRARPVAPLRRWLVRTRHTPPQSDLPAAQRVANVAGAFEVRPRARRKVAGRRILVVDDVTTTGATLAAAAAALRAGGAAQVVMLAVLRRV